MPRQPRRRLLEDGVAMGLQGYQILQGIDAGLHTGGDQAGQDAGDLRTVRAGVEQTILSLPNDQFQGPFDGVAVQGRAFDPQKLSQITLLHW